MLEKYFLNKKVISVYVILIKAVPIKISQDENDGFRCLRTASQGLLLPQVLSKASFCLENALLSSQLTPSPFGRAKCGHHSVKSSLQASFQRALPLYACHPLSTLHRALLGWVMHKHPVWRLSPLKVIVLPHTLTLVLGPGILGSFGSLRIGEH